MSTVRRRALGMLTVVVLVALFSVGVMAYLRQLSLGDITTGLGTPGQGGVAWGLFVAMDGYFLGAGFVLMLVACLWRFVAGSDAEAFARVAMPIAITCFLCAGLSVMADQGRPMFSMIHLARVARPASPMFYTFSLLGSVCLYGSLVHCVLSRRADLASYARRPSVWQPFQRLLAAGYRGNVGERLRRATCARVQSFLLMIPLLAVLVALSVILVVHPARPFWTTLIELGGFLVSAMAGGLGMLAGVAYLVVHLAGPSAGPTPIAFFKLARVMLIFCALTLFFMVAKVLSHALSMELAARRYAFALIHGDYSGLYWSGVGLFMVVTVVLMIWIRRQRVGMGGLAFVGALAQAGVFLDRYLVLVAWQTHGHSLPYRSGTYLPSANELCVGVGIAAFSVLMLLPAVRLIPFAPSAFEPELPAGLPLGHDRRRRWLTFGWAMVGSIVTVVGFLASARVGTAPSLDPVVPASPVLFIAGLVVLATTGAVYELLPDPVRP